MKLVVEIGNGRCQQGGVGWAVSRCHTKAIEYWEAIGYLASVFMQRISFMLPQTNGQRRAEQTWRMGFFRILIEGRMKHVLITVLKSHQQDDNLHLETHHLASSGTFIEISFLTLLKFLLHILQAVLLGCQTCAVLARILNPSKCWKPQSKGGKAQRSLPSKFVRIKDPWPPIRHELGGPKHVSFPTRKQGEW